MTDCNESLSELQRYLDGELDDVSCAQVLAHLDECIECYHAYDFQAELRDVIARKCGGDPLPDDLLERLSGALAAEHAAGTPVAGIDAGVALGDFGGGESAAPAGAS